MYNCYIGNPLPAEPLETRIQKVKQVGSAAISRTIAIINAKIRPSPTTLILARVVISFISLVTLGLLEVKEWKVLHGCYWRTCIRSQRNSQPLCPSSPLRIVYIYILGEDGMGEGKGASLKTLMPC